MSHGPALRRFQTYSLAELTAVLGEPAARKDLNLSELMDKAAKMGVVPLQGEPPSGVTAPPPKELIVWRCGSHARDSCMAMGDPEADQWLTTRLCNSHGGVPYDEATPADEGQLEKRRQWIATFWSTLSASLPGLTQRNADEGCCADKLLCLESQAEGASIEAVAKVKFVIDQIGSAPAKRLMSGNFNTVNATPTSAACMIALRLLVGHRVEISTAAEALQGIVVHGPADKPADVVIVLSDGEERTIDRHGIRGVRALPDAT